MNNVVREMYRTFKYGGIIDFKNGHMNYNTTRTCEFWFDYEQNKLVGKRLIGAHSNYQPIWELGSSEVHYIKVAPTYDWVDI